MTELEEKMEDNKALEVNLEWLKQIQSYWWSSLDHPTSLVPVYNAKSLRSFILHELIKSFTIRIAQNGGELKWRKKVF